MTLGHIFGDLHAHTSYIQQLGGSGDRHRDIKAKTMLGLFWGKLPSSTLHLIVKGPLFYGVHHLNIMEHMDQKYFLAIEQWRDEHFFIFLVFLHNTLELWARIDVIEIKQTCNVCTGSVKKLICNIMYNLYLVVGNMTLWEALGVDLDIEIVKETCHTTHRQLHMLKSHITTSCYEWIQAVIISCFLHRIIIERLIDIHAIWASWLCSMAQVCLFRLTTPVLIDNWDELHLAIAVISTWNLYEG
ncbi:hypothetical protein ACJX0J_037713, partial [Zea mays]